MNTKIETINITQTFGKLMIKVEANNSLKTIFEESICQIQIIQKSIKYKLYFTEKNKEKNLGNTFLFDINESFKFSNFIYEKEEYLQWISERKIYIFNFFNQNEQNKDIFLYILDRCLDSLINNIPFEELYIKNIQKLGNINDLEIHLNSIFPSETSCNEKLKDIFNLKISKKIFSAKGEIYNYDSQKESLINISKDIKAILSIYYIDNNKNNYIICSETLENNLISIDEINEKINGQVFNNKNKNFFAWETKKSYANIKGKCLGFLFDNPEEALDFKLILEKCVKDIKRRKNEKNGQIKNFIFTGSKSFYYGNEEEKNIENVENIKDKYEIMDIDEAYNELETSDENINKFTLDSILNDRTFSLTDNNQINIFKINQENDNFEKIASTSVIKEYNGNPLNINKGILYKGEQNILFLDEKNPYNLFQYDLTKEKIINEWRTGGVEISDICNKFKEGQTTINPLIYGLNQKSIFSMDSRVNNRNNIVEINTYKRSNNANTIMSSNSGEFVTGSTKGEIRLYNKITGRARNLYKYYGDYIRYIDISSDDKYLLVTYEKYLMLINITAREGKHSGFIKNIRAYDRIPPIKLQIKYNDIIKYNLENYKYNNAKFNYNKNGENNIITSLGNYAIIWNFNDVIKGKIMNYKIKKVGQIILDTSFKVGKGNKIIITMPNKIRIQNQKTILNK